MPDHLPRSDPLVEIAWPAARDAVGLEVSVLVEETARVLVAWSRDAVTAQLGQLSGRSGAQPRAGPRDDIASKGPSG
jgi:hypothetical protein